ncbi:STY0301 family protein [Roseateles chitinivorans]|uniref:STY0301 family protein n=1 Tax=Roseateles chitinivorans TaxID=2917965 RepID=UPI003D67C8DC
MTFVFGTSLRSASNGDMSQFKTAVALMLALGSLQVCAAPTPFSCPTEWASTKQEAAEVPEGFTASRETPQAKHDLGGFRINQGPIEEHQGAIYDDVKTQRDAKGGVTETMVWNVAALDRPLAICSYTGTRLVLTRPLTGYAQCTAIMRKEPGAMMTIRSVNCR